MTMRMRMTTMMTEEEMLPHPHVVAPPPIAVPPIDVDPTATAPKLVVEEEEEDPEMLIPE
jgi:hypothetical protein